MKRIVACGKFCNRDPKTCGNEPVIYKDKRGNEVQACYQLWIQMVELSRKL